MFKKILVANRGEIAVRIIRACKELGIKSAAIYTEADNKTLHTRIADESYLIGDSPSSESYLRKDKILALAKEIGAEAIHPGYGFLSENAEFIEQCEKEGITFIGPSSQSVKMMGSKTAARELMKMYSVPIVPGSTSPIKNLSDGKKTAKAIGYPILLKASAGGGGKGMRKVENEKEFEQALESTKREALKSFSNDEVYIEKYIENPKHIEVQIIADKHGNYVHLFERECSIQRRHQKIIEEAPSISVDSRTRLRITEAALNAAKACNYHNAGTIEFLMDKNKDFYFLEMNTRLQVEHPVTEMISAVDLVREQIRIAAGEKLSFNQYDLRISGHAVECRIYAEDTENNFLPSTGSLLKFLPPSGPGVRLDTGAAMGTQISLFYDPMIAKLICWAENRDEAIKRMKRALNEFFIAGVSTNITFLNKVLNHPVFLEGSFDINFLEKNWDELLKQSNAYQNEEDLSKAAIIATALFKQLGVMTGEQTISEVNVENNNKWQGLQYE